MKKINLSPKIDIIISEISNGNVGKIFGKQGQVEQNLMKICTSQNIRAENLVRMQQIHGTNVECVTSAQRGQIIPNVDGLISNDSSVVLLLRVADCIPVLIYDPEKQVISLVHSGWRGTIGKITSVAINKMIMQFGSNPSDLLIALGPSIQKCCNLFKQAPIQINLPEWKPFIIKENNMYSIDLQKFLLNTLIKVGVKKRNIKISNKCTVMESNLFSHRRSKKTGEPEGRFAVLMSFKQ